MLLIIIQYIILDDQANTNFRIYSLDIEKKFKIQILELLLEKLIRENNSLHSSSTYMVMNEAEQISGKARMLINYK